MRASLSTFAKYTPLIKFVGGPHPVPKHVGPATVHPCAPNSLMPSKAYASGTSGAATASSIPRVPFESRNMLSKRFRYTAPGDSEIENVISGGAEVIFHQ